MHKFAETRHRPPVAEPYLVGTRRTERIDSHRGKKKLLPTLLVRDERARHAVKADFGTAGPKADRHRIGDIIHIPFRLYGNPVLCVEYSLDVELTIRDDMSLLQQPIIFVKDYRAPHADRPRLDPCDIECRATARSNVERMRCLQRFFRPKHRYVKRIS